MKIKKLRYLKVTCEHKVTPPLQQNLKSVIKNTKKRKSFIIFD